MTTDPAGTPDPELVAARAKIEELNREILALKLALDVTGSIDQRTGLPNRNGLVDAIEDRRRWLARDHEPFAVMVAILPEDTDGPHVGAILDAALRDVDRVASWGDWVFGAVLPGLTPAGYETVAVRVKRALALAHATPTRLVFGTSESTPADQFLRAVEANADVAPGTDIVEM